MNAVNNPSSEPAEPDDLLSRLSQASLRITETLDLEVVLQSVVDGACSLTGAGMGGITTLDDAGQLQDFITSGLTPEEHRRFLELPGGPEFFAYLSSLPEPLRLADFSAHTRAAGLPEILPPVQTFLGTPIRHLGRQVGNLYLSGKAGGLEFTRKDEEVLVLFASQAALAIANAHRYREEQRSRADLEALLNTTPVGVVVFDARSGRVVSLNQEARRISGGLLAPGRTLDQLLEVMVFRRLDGREIGPGELPTERALRTGETVRAEEVVVHSPDGQRTTALINATPVRSEDDEIVSVLATIQDISPLEELERMRAEFLGMVSHQLRTPLTTIKGVAATLLGSSSSLDPLEARQFYRIVDEQADVMRGLLSNLLDLTRIDVGELSVTTEPTEVAALVNQARNAFLRSGARNHIEVDLAPDLPRISVDRQRMLQVLNHLFANAARHSPEWSLIRVTGAPMDIYVEISVADEGRGLSVEQLPHLFRRFNRVDDPDAVPPAGRDGLGLAICKGIVEAHGGRIWATNAGPGRGTRVSFTVPSVDEDVDDAATAPDQRADDGGRVARGDERILVVSDDPQTQSYVRNTLAAAGYSPVVTGNAHDVERLLETERPHLVLVDLALPGLAGGELMGRMHRISDAPVILLSGRGTDDDIARTFEIGAADYIGKPFSPTELVARIRNSLRKRVDAGDAAEPAPYALGDLTINYPERAVAVAGQPVQLTPVEYRLLRELSVNAGRVSTHAQLVELVWGPDSTVQTHLLRTHIKSLRRKLGDDSKNPTYIFTEPRVGYRLG